MKQILILILIVIQVSCTSSYEKEIAKELNEKDSQISLLNNLIDSLRVSENKLRNKYDSIKELNQQNSYVIDSIKIRLENELHGYWQRKAYYTSPNKQERLYHVRASISEDTVRYYFFGVNFPITSNVIYANIYELDYNKSVHVIDSIKFSGSDLPSISADDFHFEEFMLRQIDNLVIKGNKLYYYEEIERPQYSDSYYIKTSKRRYYSYELGTNKQAQLTNDTIISDHLFYGNSAYRTVTNSNKTILAASDNYRIRFYTIQDSIKLFKDLYSNQEIDFYEYTRKLQRINFSSKQYFKPYAASGLLEDSDSKQELFFGSMCWHSNEDKLYFDNSGYDYRCIWEADIRKKHMKKIIPEHKAIHPFFFKRLNKEYITYVEENKIMLAESPMNSKSEE